MIIELEKLVEGTAHTNSYEVMAYEFKDRLNKHLSRLVENTRISNLEEAINATEENLTVISLMWDGKDSFGNVVGSCLYII